MMTTIAAQLLVIYILKPITADDGSAVQAVNDECAEIAYISELASHYDKKQKDAATTVVTLTQEARVMELAAMRGQGSLAGAKYSLLAALAAAELSKAIADNSRQARGALAEARGELMRRRGHLEALRHINSATTADYKQAQRAALATTNQGSATISVDVDLQLTAAAKRATVCYTEGQQPAQIAQIAQQIKTDSNYRGVEDDAFKPPLAKLKLAAKGCTHSTADTCTSKRGCTHSSGYSGSDFLALGAATAGAKNTLKATAQPFETNSECTPTKKTGQTEDVINRARTANKICTARKEPETTYGSIKLKTVSAVLADAGAKKLAIAALGETPKQGDDEQGKNAVKKLLGNDESTTLDKFFTELENKDLQLSQDRSASKTSIKAAAEGDEYGLALAYFSGQALKRTEEAAKSVTKATQVKEEDCTSKGKDDCESEKCVVKDGVKVGNDGTTDSTCTGKKRGECEKDTGCKWEDNACKDSSFIVNRKLALMAAVFVSLLFSGFLPIFMKLVKICYFERVC
uniref:Variant surface glycoprotein n=1 Tax=Trypanosoma brucei TaxID=5691 RepID=A0A1V0FZ45_9TRYP|nr:variant surface glycoprotein [Trypanosoma brucei]